MITLMPDPEKESHDKNVRGLSDETLLRAHADLHNRRVSNRRDAEERWTLERRAALTREALRRKLNLTGR
jgi:hypothetical protein